MRTSKLKFSQSSNLIPILTILGITVIFFWKFFFKGLIPIPADIVTNTYLPWRSHYFGPVQNPILSDAISFTYPMRTLAVDIMQQGQLPLWNPYILMGTPLLANLQSAPFSPTIFLYFLTDTATAWGLQVVAQHFLAMLFMYVLLRYWKIGKSASLLGGLIYAFAGFNTIWSQWNIHTLTAAFLPIIIYFAEKLIEEKKKITGVFLSVSIAAQLLSGYPQLFIYTAAAIVILLIGKTNKIINFINISKFVLLGIGLSTIQLLPGLELILNSQRASEPIPFKWVFLPFAKTITFLIADFFGSHSAGNYWGPQNYTSNTGFIGIGVFILLIVGFKTKINSKVIVFSKLVLIAAILLSFATPISILLYKVNILGFAAATAHRALILFIFAVSIIASFGFEHLGKKRRVVLLSIISFELFFFANNFWAFSKSELIYPPTPIHKFLQEQDGLFRILSPDTIPLNLNMPYKLSSPEGYDAVYPKTTAKLLGVINNNSFDAKPQDRYGALTNETSPTVDFINVKYLITRGDYIFDDNKHSVVFKDKETQILKNKNALQRAFLERSPDQLVKGEVYLPNFVSFIVSTQSVDTLVLTDTYYPGWKAYIDNKPVSITRFKDNFRAVEVPEGKHEVKFLYMPNSFVVGAIFTVLSAASLVYILKSKS